VFRSILDFSLSGSASAAYAGCRTRQLMMMIAMHRVINLAIVLELRIPSRDATSQMVVVVRTIHAAFTSLSLRS